MSTQLKVSNMYNTGFIKNTETDIRIKQGLQPQTISSACAYQEPPKSSFPCIGVPTGYKFLCDRYHLPQARLSYEK
jgi:hypothetical protein